MRAIILPKHKEMKFLNPELGHPEHNDWIWATRSQALKLVTPRVREAIYWSDLYLAHDPRIIQSH